ncbi:MAG: asparagine synthase (glutamine-hydrolyzing) [Candidatus Omnitrophota bacterium]|nr:asparagine synthase (glutamine-hydrolyzing) [Candidatus Omnitrophota bacterium]
MCGIFGFIDFEGAPVNNSSLRNVADALSKRGPDEEGEFIRQAGNISVALLHRRLKIIDLETGTQPMADESGDINLICNGEIYNYKELRESLLAKGHRFRSRSDSEVIVHAYEEYSFDCLKHLRGMFSFAIWDNKNSLVFLARDRVGKKPLFYCTDGANRIVFASQINALLKYSAVPRDIDQRAIYQYLSYGYIPAPQTSFRAIKKLNPAHYLVFRRGGMKISRYWDLDFSRKISISETDAAHETARLLSESVKLRMLSDVPVGAFLSGGLDSSIVAALMSKNTAHPVETFSVGFEEEGYSELEYARFSRKHFPCRHHEIIMRPDSFKRLEELIGLFGEPHADSSALATMLLAEVAKKEITVTLVGEGADEVFAGYARYGYYRLARRISNAAHLPPALLRTRYKRWLGGLRSSILRGVLSKDFMNTAGKDAPDTELFKIFDESLNYKGIDAALYVDSNFFLPYDLLAKLDVSTMAFGLEARAPFLDHKLMEFAAGLPAGMKFKRNESKYILRKAFAQLLPPEVLNRKKTPFRVPAGRWFRGPLKDDIRDILFSRQAAGRGYFDRKGIERFINRHLQGKADLGQEIWALVVLELWHRIFIDEANV